jgi:tetratricopeptide (TPR) repeat protein
MKKKKMKRNRCSAGHSSAGDHSRGKFVTKCGTILLVAASYQVFPLCMDPAGRYLQEGQDKGKTWLGKASTQISSVFVTPAIAAPPINECRCVGGHVGGGCGCTGCMGCTGCTGCTGSCTGCTGRTHADEVNDYNNTYKEYVKAWQAGRWAEVEALIRRMLAFQPGPRNYNLLGLTLIYQGRYDEAEEALKKAKALDGSSFSMPDYLKESYNFLYRSKGSTFDDQGRYAEAETALKKALEFDSNDSESYNILGIVLKNQKRYDEAIKAYEKALKINPKHPYAKNNLQYLKGELASNKADELYNKKDYAGAEAAYREAIKLDPNNSYLHQQLGRSLFLQARYADSEAASRQAVKLEPNNARAHNTLAVVLRKQGKLSEAETELRTAIRVDPNYTAPRNVLADVLNDKGIELYKQGKFWEAEGATREAVKLNPKNEEAHNTLGVVLEKQGKLSEAEATYRTALALDQNYTTVRNNLSDLLVDKGKSLYTQGKTSEAEAAFREALALNPVSPTASQALALIKMSGAAPSTAPASPTPSSPSLAGLEFVVPANKPIGQSGSSDPRTITLVVKEDGRDVPIIFILPDDPRTGPTSPSAQLQSASLSGEKAKEAGNKVAGDQHDPTGDLARAKHLSGNMFDRPGEPADSLAPVVLQGLPVREKRVIPPELLKDEIFVNLLKERGRLLEKQQELESQLKDVRRKKESATNRVEKGNLEMEEVNIKQKQSSIPGQIRIQEIEIGKWISRALEWPKQEKATEKNQAVTPQPSSENVKEKSSGGKAQ